MITDATSRLLNVACALSTAHHLHHHSGLFCFCLLLETSAHHTKPGREH